MVAPKGALFVLPVTQSDLLDLTLAAVSSSASAVAVRAKCARGLGKLDFCYQGSGGNMFRYRFLSLLCRLGRGFVTR